jgi:rod shape-determining protein MreC
MRLNRRFKGNKNNFFYQFLSRINLRVGIIVFIIFAVFILNLSPFSTSIKEFFYSISEPIQVWLWEKGITSSGLFKGILGAESLDQENRALIARNQELLRENIQLEEFRKENELLKTALGLGLEKEFELVLAQVIAKDIGKDYLVINKGFQDDMEFGFPVITESKVLIGKIIETYENFSKIELLTAENSSFDIEIFKKEIYSLAKGSGNFKIILDLIPKEESIEIGDKVITSALGGNFPKGLLVGEIQSIEKSDIAAFQQAQVRPNFEIRDLKEIFIIKDFGFSQ